MTVDNGSLLCLLMQEDQGGQQTGGPLAQDADVDLSHREECATLKDTTEHHLMMVSVMASVM